MDDYQFNTILQAITGVNARLDRMNGRVSDNEQEIAVLKDRSDRAERQGGIIGGIMGGAVTGIVLTVKALMGK